MSDPYESLNANQRSAVLWGDGPLLVLAGPGSGKTMVLTNRVVRLLREREDASVLALTFTNKAASEMRQRVDALLGKRADRAHLCTFHSFAVDLLKQHGSHLEIKPDFVLLTRDEDRLPILQPVAKKLADEGNPVPGDLKGLLELLDRLFGEAYAGSGKAASLVNTPTWLPALFAEYCTALVDQNRLDFGSLLYFARRLLTECPAVARVTKIAWTHVCVDEFQDTNKSQYDLLLALIDKSKPNLFVVADDDQIIYQWNGASPERLQALRTDFQMDVVQLPESYRCPPAIIDLANRLIVHNKSRSAGKKPLEAFRKAPEGSVAVRFREFGSPEEEVAFIASDIKARAIPPGECALLGRTTKLLEVAAEGMRATGIQAYVAHRKTDFESAPVAAVYSALRLGSARHDRDALRRLCVSWSALSGSTREAEAIEASSSLVGGDFLRAWLEASLADKQGALLSDVLRKVGTSLVDSLNYRQLVEWFLGDGWKPWNEGSGGEVAQEIATWKELEGELIREHGLEALTLNTYIQQMDLVSKTPAPPPNAVRCMTVHGAKGLEFSHVYVIGLSQEVMPSFQALKKGSDSRELEEERRNCFVAITRTRETLTLTRSREYYGWEKRPSQFLQEMGILART